MKTVWLLISPVLLLMSVRPSARAESTLLRQASLPTSQSNESICRSSRSGTSIGSAIFAKEILPVGDTKDVFDAVREAANRRSSEGSESAKRAPRMLSGPSQMESKRRGLDRVRGANPKYRRARSIGQGPERSKN